MKVQIPEVKERVNFGNDIIGFIIIDIVTRMDDYVSKQKEIRFILYPLQLEISYYYEDRIRIGISIFHYTFGSEIKYGKRSRI